MRKRTPYYVHIRDGEIARFSDYGDACLYCRWLSIQNKGYTYEVRAKDGLVGQYQFGRATPEFQPHHEAWFAATDL